MPGSPVFRDSVALPCRSFVFHSNERAEREKTWTIGLFKLHRCLWKNASLPRQHVVRACIRKVCTHRRGSPAADERPNNNKRQQENAEPRRRLRLENQTGLLSGGHVLLVFHLFVTSFLHRAPFFFTRWIHRQDNSIYNYATFNQLSLLGFLLPYCDIVPESMLFRVEKLNKHRFAVLKVK